MRLPWSLAMISTRPFLKTPTLKEKRIEDYDQLISCSQLHIKCFRQTTTNQNVLLTKSRWSPNQFRLQSPHCPSCPPPRRLRHRLLTLPPTRASSFAPLLTEREKKPAKEGNTTFTERPEHVASPNARAASKSTGLLLFSMLMNSFLTDTLPFNKNTSKTFDLRSETSVGALPQLY